MSRQLLSRARQRAFTIRTTRQISATRRRHTRWPVRAIVAVAFAAAIPGGGVAHATPPAHADLGGASIAASNPSIIARSTPTRLIQSTGNLYWTTHNLNEFGPSTASVYRASKSSTPGNERLLYREIRSGAFHFGDITYANVGGVWYGYFVANYLDLGVSRIKRIPLAGGAAVTLATSPRQVGLGDLETDGSTLYWADQGGLRKMPIGGGGITTLVAGSDIRSVGLASTRVYYSGGTALRSVAKTGGATTTHAIGSTNVTSMYIHRSLPNPVIYWGEANAAVKSHAVAGGTTIHQAPIAGHATNSVSFDGKRILWTDCMSGNRCNVRKRQGGTTSVVSSGGIGASNVQGDRIAMFWGDGAVKKYVH
jgi:hypothetical protein